MYMSLLDTPDTTARLFIGLAIPDKAKQAIYTALRHYSDYTERKVPEENWHMTLVFLGDIENHKQYISRLSKPIPQAFMPAISLTHLGRGLQRKQLWTYANPTPAVVGLKKSVEDRLKKLRMPYKKEAERDFVPHIRVADMYDITSGIGIPDGVINETFTPKEAYLYQSQETPLGVRYTIEATIPL